MGSTSSDFDTRKSEVEHFFLLLEQLSVDSDPLKQPPSAVPVIYKSDISARVAKASFFLVLYNLVESTVRSAFSSLWSEVSAQKISVSDLSVPLRKVWLKHEFRRANALSATPNTYREIATEIVEFALSSKVPEVEFRQLSGGGNWGIVELLEFCDDHGLKFRPSKAVHGGADLTTIKDNRNRLAHGLMTFDEVGRTVSVDELRLIKERTIAALASLSSAVEKYVEKARYRA